jgi:hypothetical protein
VWADTRSHPGKSFGNGGGGERRRQIRRKTVMKKIVTPIDLWALYSANSAGVSGSSGRTRAMVTVMMNRITVIQ